MREEDKEKEKQNYISPLEEQRQKYLKKKRIIIKDRKGRIDETEV